MVTGLVHLSRPADAALEALADTLSALVSGVAAGLVADAVVIVPAPDPGVATVVEATGATLVVAPAGTDPWRAGAAAARRDWVLCLAAGDVPAEGWIRAVDRFIAEEHDRSRGPVIGRMRRGDGWLARLSAWRLPTASWPHGARAGDVLRREHLLAPRPARTGVRRLTARIERPSHP